MNNRWRQVAKFIEDKHDRWEYEGDNAYKPPTCQCCGSRLITASWYDVGCVETLERCQCGYEEHWAYGQTDLKVGNWSETYQYNTPEDQIMKIRNEFDRQISKFRAKQKRYNQSLRPNRG
ncbi:MAG: hypothetical protein K0Q81_679 [Paenibacillus sp.]|jgi:hypothetical protein|nr:hypothetical protein [Paenibacillus sp.]